MWSQKRIILLRVPWFRGFVYFRGLPSSRTLLTNLSKWLLSRGCGAVCSFALQPRPLTQAAGPLSCKALMFSSSIYSCPFLALKPFSSVRWWTASVTTLRHSDRCSRNSNVISDPLVPNNGWQSVHTAKIDGASAKRMVNKLAKKTWVIRMFVNVFQSNHVKPIFPLH